MCSRNGEVVDGGKKRRASGNQFGRRSEGVDDSGEAGDVAVKVRSATGKCVAIGSGKCGGGSGANGLLKMSSIMAKQNFL